MQNTLSELLKFEDAVRTLISGEHLGMRAGDGGFEFDHVREWEPGDSARSINKTASYRHGDLLVNARLPDRELEVVFMVDTSASMHFASRDKSKLERTWCFVEKAMQIIERDRPVFSLCCQNENGVELTPLGLGENARTHLQHVKTGKKVGTEQFSLPPLLRFLQKRKGRTYLVLIFSDFAGVSENYQNELRALTRAGHKVAGVAVLDLFEVTVPSIPLGVMNVCDAESGSHTFISGAREFLVAHEAVFKTAHGQFTVFDETNEEEVTV